jgi:hypothetical protein
MSRALERSDNKRSVFRLYAIHRHQSDVPVLGFRLLYRPAQGSGSKRTTSESFNLDMTCSS